MNEIVLPYQWSPRLYQQPLWNYLKHGGKRAVVVWPRRHGKDDVCLQHAVCSMGRRKGTYWYLLPQYGQARKSMWDAIDEERGQRRIDVIVPPAIRTLYREQEMMVGFAGSTLQMVGADNFNTLVGSPPIGVVFSEAARTDPQAWPYIMPILEKNGGWAAFNSTPYGGNQNHYKALYEMAQTEPGWFAELLQAPQCGVYSEKQLQDILRQLQAVNGEDYGYALWRQEYFCAFDAAIPGAIWADCLVKAEREGRIVDFELDRTVPVRTAWDLGRTDDTAIWWYQVRGEQIDIIDHHSSSFKDIPFYMDLLRAKRTEHALLYAVHRLPHDARPRTLAAGGKSIFQQCVEAARLDHALGRFQIGKRLDVQEGIQAARATFPRCRFHKTRTAKGRESLKQYHREWDEETKSFRDRPAHDWASHDADAFRELALSWTQLRESPRETPWQEELTKATLPNITYSQLREQHFASRRRLREWAR